MPLDTKRRSGARDLSSLLDSTTQGRPCVAPASPIGTEPREIEIRPNTYHGLGLLPWGFRWSWIVAPCNYSPTCWVGRHLTGSKVLKVLNIPGSLQSDLKTGDIELLCQAPFLIPTKVTTNLLDTIQTTLTTPYISSQVPSKRIKVSNNFQDVPAPQKTDDTWTVGRLADIPIDKNAKVTKSDDTEIPEDLWNKFVYPNGSATEIKVLDTIQKGITRWWKKHLMLEFEGWMQSWHANMQTRRALGDLVAGQEYIEHAGKATFGNGGVVPNPSSGDGQKSTVRWYGMGIHCGPKGCCHNGRSRSIRKLTQSKEN
jgi:hypothetical protein